MCEGILTAVSFVGRADWMVGKGVQFECCKRGKGGRL